MKIETTASAVRYEKMRSELKQRQFTERPESLPEAIARHYTAHAIIAKHFHEPERKDGLVYCQQCQNNVSPHFHTCLKKVREDGKAEGR